MNWNDAEQAQVSRMIAQYDLTSGSYITPSPNGTLELRLSEMEALKQDLADFNGGALLVRHILKGIGFDETRLFSFRLEHKLIQAHLLQHYCAGAVPLTLGVSRFVSGRSARDADRNVRRMYEKGFIIKPTLGAGSTPSSLETPPDVERVREKLPNDASDSLTAETYVFQQRLRIAEEYRIHSIENRIIPNLSYFRYSLGSPKGEAFRKAINLVRAVLDAVPRGLTRDSLFGWDVAVDCSGKAQILEANPAGLHPVFRRGFQCSGFFHLYPWRIPCILQFLAFLRDSYHISVQIERPDIVADNFTRTYWLVSTCQSLGKVSAQLVRPASRRDEQLVPHRFTNGLSGAENALLWTLETLQALAGSPNRHSEAPTNNEPINQRSAETRDVPYGLAPHTCNPDHFESSSAILSEQYLATLRSLASSLGTTVESILTLAWALTIGRASRGHAVFGVIDVTAIISRSLIDLNSSRIVVALDTGAWKLGDALNKIQKLFESRGDGTTIRSSRVNSLIVLCRNEQDRVTFASLNRGSIPSTDSSCLLVLSAVYGDHNLALELSAPRQLGSDRVLKHYETALHSILAALKASHFDLLCAELVTLPASERKQLIRKWNPRVILNVNTETVYSRFKSKVDNTPDAIAIEEGASRTTYRELHNDVMTVAMHLKALGVVSQDRVAICLPRNASFIASALAINRLDGAYVPLDPILPPDRIYEILADCCPRAILTDPTVSPELSSSDDIPTVVNIPNLLASSTVQSKEDDDDTPTHDRQSHILYVMYTSGSSGSPKGVEIYLSSVSRLFMAILERLGERVSGPWLGITSISFDISILELLFPLTVGGSVIIVGQHDTKDATALIRAMQRSPLIVQATPTTWRMLIEAGWEGTSALIALCGGEPLEARLANELVNRCSIAWNMYGPTESTVWAFAEQLTPSASYVCIGRPLANTRAYILDDWKQPVPLGATGELYLGGVGIAKGYLNNPALTNKQFLRDPFVSDCKARMYKTGDYARYLNDGRVQILGRTDSQVKIHGHRVELGEIEARLRDISGILDAAVVLSDTPHRDSLLVAYCVTKRIHRARAIPISEDSVRDSLSKHLPSYMVPSVFVFVHALPIMLNGKCDRKLLQELPNDRRIRSAETAPPSATELELCRMLGELFGIQQVETGASFRSLGGTSILANRLANQLKLAFSVEIPLFWLLANNPTIGDIAKVVEYERAREASPPK